MRFEEKYGERIRRINEQIRTYLPQESGPAATFLSAMNYSMQAGGKRLRPLLIHLSCELFGGREEAVTAPFMAALEMIHTHSLIHDDLPALDNDDYRRGRKTNHIVYGEAMAILAGDGLLNLAYETAARAFEAAPGDVRAEKAFMILAGKTGRNGMLGGQSLDVEMDGKPLSMEQLDYIYRNKTGALLSCALMCGAALAGAGEETLAVLEQIGEKIGYAFQIRDDILDVEGDPAVLGKPVGSDEKNHKTTYVSLMGIEKAREDVAAMTEDAMRLLGGIAPGENALSALLYDLTQRDD